MLKGGGFMLKSSLCGGIVRIRHGMSFGIGKQEVFSWSGGVAVSREKGRESRGTIQKAESEDRKGGC